MPRATYQTLIEGAVTATSAGSGWLLRPVGDHFTVVAAAGWPALGDRVGETRPIIGTAALVFGSGNPAALQLRSGDETNRGAGGADGIPRSILAVPCNSADETTGVIELVEASGGAFSFDDVELVSLLASVAGSLLAEDDGREPAVPTPDELVSELHALAVSSPLRYAGVAAAIQALLGQ